MPAASGRTALGSVAVGGGFFLTGIVSVLLGPIIPELRASWNVTQAQAAWLFVAQFAASSIGAALSSFHLRRSLLTGYSLITAGLTGLATGGWAMARPAMALTGLGLGLVIAASNLLVAHRNPGRRGASLATLNLAWGLGAVSSPLLIAGGRGLMPLEATLATLAAAAALASVAVWLYVADDAGAVAPPRDGKPASGPGLVPLFLVAAILFLYVGSETAVGGWLVTLSDQLGGDRPVASLLIGSGFWGAILIGRAVTPWMLRRLSEAALYRVCLTLAAAGTLVLVLARSRALLAAGSVLAGLGMAPLFPLTVSILAAATAASRSRTVGWVLACGGLGGAAIPWLTGRLGGDTGAGTHGIEALPQAFLVPLLALIALAGLYALRHAWSR